MFDLQSNLKRNKDYFPFGMLWLPGRNRVRGSWWLYIGNPHIQITFRLLQSSFCQDWCCLNTFVCRSEVISHESRSHNEEVHYISNVFKQNGFPGFTRRVIFPKKSSPQSKNEIKAATSILFVRGVSEKIQRVCMMVSITVCLKSNKTSFCTE